MAEALYKDLNEFTPTSREYSEEERAVYQSVINIINTRPGERLFQPNFGVDLSEFLFETVSDTSEIAILNAVGTAIEQFDNRVEMDFEQSEVRLTADENSLELKLVFSILGVGNQTYQLIEAIR